MLLAWLLHWIFFFIKQMCHHEKTGLQSKTNPPAQILQGIVLSRQQLTKVLIRLHRCTGWSAPLLFAYVINGFVMTRLINESLNWFLTQVPKSASLYCRIKDEKILLVPISIDSSSVGKLLEDKLKRKKSTWLHPKINFLNFLTM